MSLGSVSNIEPLDGFPVGRLAAPVQSVAVVTRVTLRTTPETKRTQYMGLVQG